jgi:hypothetical protein
LLVRQLGAGQTPDIYLRGGSVKAPFSFDFFLANSDKLVLKILLHYTGQQRGYFEDMLLGGESEVGFQLKEAASLQPLRFLNILRVSWSDISSVFCDYIFSGAATHLQYMSGNLQIPASWSCSEKIEQRVLCSQLLDELERHPSHWHGNRDAANVLAACAHATRDHETASRIVFLSIGFSNLPNESALSGEERDLINVGINMPRGQVVEALLIVSNGLVEHEIVWPELLEPTLRTFAKDDHPAIRALILRHLPSLLHFRPHFAWPLFDIAVGEYYLGIWCAAESCLYSFYAAESEKTKDKLDKLLAEAKGKDLETWGRISALSSFNDKSKFTKFIDSLKNLNSLEAWRGAATVWTHQGNINENREQCFVGITEGLLQDMPISENVAREVDHLFSTTSPPVVCPDGFIQIYFESVKQKASNGNPFAYHFDEWLNALSSFDVSEALDVVEKYATYLPNFENEGRYQFGDFTRLLTNLFSQAEEQEESDNGLMLRRVIALQDTFLTLGNSSVDAWLSAAERP